VRDPNSDAGTPFRPGNNTVAPPSRPDLDAARGNSNSNNGNNGNNSNNGNNGSGLQVNVTKRPDMRGPTDISNILSGLKPKTIPSSQQTMPSMPSNQPNANEDKTSTISISDLKELQNDNLPHRSKRRQRSDKNTVSLALDI
jgi:hypothetical protein